jgi:membrane protease YdiL (CAAX protease family)
MKSSSPIIISIVLTILITIISQFDNYIGLSNSLYDDGASFEVALLSSFLTRFILGVLILVILIPYIRKYEGKWRYYGSYVKVTQKIFFIGLILFLLFCLVALLTSLSLGIFISDPNVIFGKPDISTTPDTIGWFYFLLAINPGLWEELVFRGIILSDLKERYSERIGLYVSTLLFGLFHFSNLIFQSFEDVLGGVIMATTFGLFWGYLTIKTGSIFPAMMSHYLIDAFGAYFLNIDRTNEMLNGPFFLSIIILYPLVGIFLTRIFSSRIEAKNNVNAD